MWAYMVTSETRKRLIKQKLHFVVLRADSPSGCGTAVSVDNINF